MTEFPDETMPDIGLLAALENGTEKMTSKDKEKILHDAERVVKKAVELCQVYPGDHAVFSADSVAAKRGPFSIRMEDFRLVNILIDPSTGTVNGFIDFEAATTAPLWVVATVPDWIPDPDSDMASWYGGTPEDQRHHHNLASSRCQVPVLVY